MGLIFLILVFLVVSFCVGVVPIIGPILLGFGVESFNWNMLKKVPGGSLAINGIFFYLVTVSGLVFSSFVFYEPAPLGLAHYEPVPGMALTQLVIFVIAFALARSKRA